MNKNSKASSKKGRNKYSKSAKISEYRFLRILRAFADGLPPLQAAKTMQVSEKTIRSTYRELRLALLKAVVMSPMEFGGAGFFLFEGTKLSARGKLILKEVVKGPNYQAHFKKQVRRKHLPADTNLILLEMAIRLFSSIHLSKTDEALYPEETREAVQQLSDITIWIKEKMAMEDFASRHKDLIVRYMKVSKQMRALLSVEELKTVKDKSTMHRYPDDVLYEGLRAFLRKHPL